ncbi:MAG: hypothetical protein ACUVTV_09260 [Anaerolineae bacterium]
MPPNNPIGSICASASARQWSAETCKLPPAMGDQRLQAVQGSLRRENPKGAEAVARWLREGKISEETAEDFPPSAPEPGLRLYVLLQSLRDKIGQWMYNPPCTRGMSPKILPRLTDPFPAGVR